MADAEARREARRKRILENSEKRMQILLNKTGSLNDCSTTESKETHAPGTGEQIDTKQTTEIDGTQIRTRQKTRETKHATDEIQDISAGGESTESLQPAETLSTESQNSNLRKRNTITLGPPSTENRSSNSSQSPQLPTDFDTELTRGHHGPKVTGSGTNTMQQKTPAQKFDLLRIVSCTFIALLSRLVLNTGYGIIYFQSIFLPFVVLEAGLVTYKHYMLKNISLPHYWSYLSTGLMLCGLKPDMISKYNNIMGYVTLVLEDMMFYMFAFLVSCVLIGGQVVG